MENQYWVGDHFVDLSRNQVIRAEQTLTLQPKALAVLTFLAQHQGKVVSHDTLMANVWADSVVSPNSLQRIIAQLRKALGDDSKTQAIIQTHAKQGYSLECPVRWQQKASTDEPTRIGKNAKAGLLIVVVILAFSITAWWPKQPNALAFDTLTQVTASDEKELTPSYSPDGRHIVFHRYNGLCKNDLWAKDLTTNQETRLTSIEGSYHSHSFSADGKQLIFTSSVPCGQPQQARHCRQVMTLDFIAAQVSPLPPKLKIDCDQGDMSSPFLVEKGRVAVLQQQSERWKLVTFDEKADKSIDLFAPDKQNFYSLSYSIKRNIFATMGVRNDGEHILSIITDAGQLISSTPIVRPPDFSKLRFIYHSFVPNRDQVVFGAGKRLYSLSFSGQIQPIDAPLSQYAYQPQFNPKGDKLVVSQGVFDSDIAQVNLANSPNKTHDVGFNQVFTPHPSIARSTFAERNGQFQPNGEYVAFLSDRSDTAQLWISDGKSTRPLTQFKTDTIIKGLSWHPDGERLVIAANNLLYQVTLAGEMTAMTTAHTIDQVFDWNRNNIVLLNARIGGLLTLARYDINTKKLTSLSKHDIEYALFQANDNVLYKDGNNDYWLDNTPIKALSGKTDAFRFALSGANLYGVNKGGMLWSYNIDTNHFKSLQQLDKHVSFVSDIKEQQLLVTQTISARKEIVELNRRF